MINVFIDTSALAESMNLDERQIADLLDFTVEEVTERFAEQWRMEANRTLKGSRAEYINNIIVVKEGFAKGSVMLVGELSNSLETGLDSFDMKPGLLNGPNSRETKSGGRYNVVPFSIGTPNALEENFNGGIMPQEVYEVAKKLVADRPMIGGGKSSAPLKVEQIPDQFKEPVSKSVTLPKTKEVKDYKHKSSIYVGIRKVEDPSTGQNRYQSFRAVSTNSDPSSWIHPGIQAQNIAESAMESFNIPSETGRAIDKFLNSMG